MRSEHVLRSYKMSRCKNYDKKQHQNTHTHAGAHTHTHVRTHAHTFIYLKAEELELEPRVVNAIRGISSLSVSRIFVALSVYLCVLVRACVCVFYACLVCICVCVIEFL